MISNVHFDTLNCLYSFDEKSFSFFSSFFSSLFSSFFSARETIMTAITILTISRRFSSIKSIILRREISSMIDVRRVKCELMFVKKFRFVEFESMSVSKEVKNEKKNVCDERVNDIRNERINDRTKFFELLIERKRKSRKMFDTTKCSREKIIKSTERYFDFFELRISINDDSNDELRLNLKLQ